jgi:putative membrane protein (TIGR04086 family)
MIVIGALLIVVADISDNATGYFATAFIAISGFFCGYFSAKKFGGRVVIIGFLSGLIFYLTIAVISVAITKGGFTSLVVLSMILTVAMAIFGAILSTFKKKKVKIL